MSRTAPAARSLPFEKKSSLPLLCTNPTSLPTTFSIYRMDHFTCYTPLHFPSQRQCDKDDWEFHLHLSSFSSKKMAGNDSCSSFCADTVLAWFWHLPMVFVGVVLLLPLLLLARR
mmetsp:Transcript_27463/g.49685  ORF Transcript_27463/g.49685 Transcript_27463/m.49685 type:complete len:115 (+) Transcript_27463:3-347(+)